MPPTLMIQGAAESSLVSEGFRRLTFSTDPKQMCLSGCLCEHFGFSLVHENCACLLNNMVPRES